MTASSEPRTAMLFLNLPVRDLERSKAFFAGLGFGFNLQLTDANAACMVLGKEAFVMLLTEPRFADFTTRPTADATKVTEALFCFSAASRADVDHVVDAALDGGGSLAAPTQDLGFMYGRSFNDLDGHHWEVMWMDTTALAAA